MPRKALGITVLGNDKWDANQPDYQSLFQGIAAKNPQAIFLGGLISLHGGQLIKDKVKVLGDNSKVLLLGPDGFNDSATVTDAGAAAEGMYVTIGGQDPNALTNATGKAFVAAYKKTYKVDHLEAYTAYGAQAFLVLANAIAKSDGTRASILKGLYNQSFPKGIIGSFKIDNTGDPNLGGVTVDQYVGGAAEDHHGRSTRRPRWRSRHSANHAELAEARTTGGARGWRPTARHVGPSSRSLRACGAALNAIVGICLLGLVALWLVENFVREPKQFVLVFLAGITNGSIYALVALGYTIVYGILELINFAHGDVFTWGAMVTYTVAVSWIGLDGSQSGFLLFGALLLALICSAIFCATLNMAIERVAYRRLRNAPRLAPLITAIGMSFVLSNLIGVIFGFSYKSSNALLPHGADLPHRQPGLRLGQADRPAHHDSRPARRSSGWSRPRAGARRCARPRRIAMPHG